MNNCYWTRENGFGHLKRFQVVIGMYHDQVLTPIKTLYKFEAINITLGLPYIRISPDHGTNNEMLGLKKSYIYFNESFTFVMFRLFCFASMIN